MISVIILKYREELFRQAEANIRETIGTDYELIVVDNTASQYTSIAAAYNAGAEKASSEYLCFVHEDVVIKTQNWGQALLNDFANDGTTGLIGLVGSKFKSYQPTSYTNMIENGKYIVSGTNGSRDVEDVVCVDGLFLMTRKSAWARCRFDEKLIRGFHGYDMDYSLQVLAAGFRVVVHRGIAFAHYSSGNRNAEWYNTNKAVSRKWRKLLPVISRDLEKGKRQLLSLELKTIVHLSGSNRLKNLVKVPLRFFGFLLRKV